jgi:hypothetical protein
MLRACKEVYQQLVSKWGFEMPYMPENCHMQMQQYSHGTTSMDLVGSVRIYSPCMSRHEGVNISRGACLMH